MQTKAKQLINGKFEHENFKVKTIIIRFSRWDQGGRGREIRPCYDFLPIRIMFPIRAFLNFINNSQMMSSS